MANAILNFHFDFPHTSLILSKPKIKVLSSFPVLSVQWRGFVESRCDFSNESRLAMFTHYHHHQQQQLWQQNWSDRKSRDFIRRCEIIQPRDIPCIVVSRETETRSRAIFQKLKRWKGAGCHRDSTLRWALIIFSTSAPNKIRGGEIFRKPPSS